MDLHILSKIASYSLESYNALLAIPQFARTCRANNYKFLYNFWRKETNDDGDMLQYFNNKVYFIKRKDGTNEWYKDGKLHRDDDAPAIVTSNGCAKWYNHGLLHRDNDLPASIHTATCGYHAYENNGRCGDNDRAIDITNGDKYWYQNGQLHRDNDLPAIIRNDNKVHCWYQNGQKHRDYPLPAVMHEAGRRVWYYHNIEYHFGTNTEYLEAFYHDAIERDHYNKNKEFYIFTKMVSHNS